MSECSSNCSSCGQSDCASRKADFKVAQNEYSNIKNVIGVVSGKGGVGKSLVTSELAVLLSRKGYKVGVLDADITGPSIPKVFGIHEQAVGDDKGIIPAVTRGGIKVISINMLLDDEETPVIWRGPVLAGVVKQFWNEVIWGDIDYTLVDMPPGTGDVALTVFQSLPIDGIIVVSTPQQLVSMIVEKALRMANMMNIKVYGIIENMSYITCDKCGNKVSLFGKDNIELLAKRFNLDILAQLPLDPNLTSVIDKGQVEEYQCEEIDQLVQKFDELL